MADATPQLGGLEGENGGHTCREDEEGGGGFAPGGAKTESKQTGQTNRTDEVKKRGGLFGHIQMHFGGDVSFLVERGLDLTHFEPGVSGVTGLSHDGSKKGDKEGEGKTHGKDGGLRKKYAREKNGGKKENKDNGKVVEHDVEVFGWKEGQVHGKGWSEGGSFQLNLAG